jgi:hypothetical protein
MIEHLGYPRDLHLFKTESFIEELKGKVLSVANAVKEKKYRPFIKNFSHVEAGKIPTETRSIDEVLLERVERLAAEVRALRRSSSGSKPVSGGTYHLSSKPFKDFMQADDTLPFQREFKLRVPLGKEMAVSKLLAEESAVSFDHANPGLLRVSFPPWVSLYQVASAFRKVADASIEVTIVADESA